MLSLKCTFSLAAIMAVTACSAQKDDDQETAPLAEQSATRIANGDLTMADGTLVGPVKIVLQDSAIEVVVAPENLPEGPHGFHLHQTGQCDAPDFKSAGGHLNPLGKSHGRESPDGAHVGDLPNLTIAADSTDVHKFALEGTEAQVSEWLFDEDGTAVVIHAGPDDYKTDPAGAAGARIACAVLSRG